MASIWMVAYDAENSENPGWFVEVTLDPDGTMRTDPQSSTKPAERT